MEELIIYIILFLIPFLGLYALCLRVEKLEEFVRQHKVEHSRKE